MSTELALSFLSSQKFTDARRGAFFQAVLGFFNRKSKKLLPFEDIRSTLKLDNTRYLGLQNVDLDKIVGSVGRYDDFTREFLPRRDSQEVRWRRVYDLTESAGGVSPVELFKVGKAYFVRDGNHRVSVARTNNNSTIEAYVIEYITPVEVTTEDTMDDILIKSGETNFLKATHLNELRPDQYIHLTNPGRYRLLLEHIAVHKYFREIEGGCEIPYEEAVMSWYDNVYMPIVGEIRSRDILKHFPGRTEADLYAWIVLHRTALENVYGLGQVDTDEIVEDLEEEASASPIQKVERAVKRKLDPASLPPSVE